MFEATVTGDDRQQWQQGTPADWALESLAIVRAQVYRLPAYGEINASYSGPGTRCDSDSLSASGSETGVDAE